MYETMSLVELEGRRFAAKWARERDVWEVVDWERSEVVATGLSEAEARGAADKLESA